VSVVLFSDVAEPTADVFIRNEATLIAGGTKTITMAPEDISRVHAAFKRARIRTPRLAAPLSLGDSVGIIVLHFKSSTLEILLANTFVLKIAGKFTENGAFYSPELAATINIILKEVKNQTLADDRLNDLSGHTVLLREREKYFDEQFDDGPLIFRRDTTIGRGPINFSTYKPLKLASAGPAESLAWAGIDFVSRNQLDGMRIRLGYGREWLNVEVTDSFTLRQAQEGVRQSWKRVPWRGTFFGQAPYGQIEFYANKRKVVIYLNASFHVVKGSEGDNGFESWTLAKVVHDVILRTTGKGLSRMDFQVLAGRPPAINDFIGQ
jgi:hypothetical protein